ncbi:Uncharacterised protein [uncultured archaeon]|nr:Uncharacterised protein [uncultured archaeon]
MLRDNFKHFFLAVVSMLLIIGVLGVASGQKIEIPSWIKNNAQWWYEDKIADSDFTNGIQYLIKNQIIIMPPENSTVVKVYKIPVWVKNNAGWWANGTISDNEFIAGIQYLVSSGIIFVNPPKNFTVNNPELQCDSLTTPAEKETCLQQITYETKIKNSLASATPYDVGPVTFYYVGSEIQPADDGKSILTIHFVVEDYTDQEITMSCTRQDSCNYALSDGEKEIPYATNTLVYGSLTLIPKTPRLVDWTFYDVFDKTRNYSFLVKESWGSRSLPLKIQW